MNYYASGELYERDQTYTDPYYRNERPQVYNNDSESSDSSSSVDSQECVVLVDDDQMRVQKQVSLLPLEITNLEALRAQRVYENANEEEIIETVYPLEDSSSSSSSSSESDYKFEQKPGRVIEEKIVIEPGEVFVEQRIESSTESEVSEDIIIEKNREYLPETVYDPYVTDPYVTDPYIQPTEVVIVNRDHKHYKKEDIIITSPQGVIIEEVTVKDPHSKHHKHPSTSKSHKQEEEIIVNSYPNGSSELVVVDKNSNHNTEEVIILNRPNGVVIEEVVATHPHHHHHHQAKEKEEVFIQNTLTDMVRSQSMNKKNKRPNQGSGACRDCEIF